MGVANSLVKACIFGCTWELRGCQEGGSYLGALNPIPPSNVIHSLGFHCRLKCLVAPLQFHRLQRGSYRFSHFEVQPCRPTFYLLLRSSASHVSNSTSSFFKNQNGPLLSDEYGKDLAGILQL